MGPEKETAVGPEVMAAVGLEVMAAVGPEVEAAVGPEVMAAEEPVGPVVEAVKMERDVLPLTRAWPQVSSASGKRWGSLGGGGGDVVREGGTLRHMGGEMSAASLASGSVSPPS